MTRFEEVWEAFGREGTVADHWSTWGQAWDESSYYLAYLIPLERHPAVVEAAQAIQAELAFRFVDIVPPESLHVTVQEAGFEDQLGKDRLESLVSEAALILREVEPFSLRIGTANSFTAAAILEIDDAGELLRVRSRFREAMPWLAGPSRRPMIREPAEFFAPHVSIAYYNARADNRRVVQALQRFRPFDAGEVRVETIELVKASKPVRRYRWERIASLELGRD